VGLALARLERSVAERLERAVIASSSSFILFVMAD
jgi:hypothetical protein